MKKLISILFLSCLGNVFSQSDSLLKISEERLFKLLNDLRSAQNDQEKATKNQLFKNELYASIQLPGAYTYPFSKLTTVGFVDSPDGTLRIINWNVEQDDQTEIYYSYLMHKEAKSNEIEISELTDNSMMLPPKPDDILEANNWYGALYYKIIPIQKGSKTLYTVLGWDGNNAMSSMKLIDVIYFAGKHPKLGSPVFKTKDATLKRVFYEHSKKATMSMRYEPEYQRIIFDHLSPESPGLEGFYSYYVPDLSYDAFILDKGKWVLKEDVIGVNKETDKKLEVYVENERTGKVEKKQIKNKWENPENAEAPAGDSQHKAVTPESDPENNISAEAQKTLEKKQKKAKKDKRNANALNTTLSGGSKKTKKKHKY